MPLCSSIPPSFSANDPPRAGIPRENKYEKIVMTESNFSLAYYPLSINTFFFLLHSALVAIVVFVNIKMTFMDVAV